MLILELLRAQFQRLFPDEAFKSSDPSLVFLDQVGGLSVIIERASLILAHPNPDQVARHVVALARPCSVSPAMNSCATCRLSSIL